MLAFIIFALTLFGILRRPFGFGIWVYSSIGAVATFALGLVELRDLGFIFSLIWDSALTLIALIVISYCLQAFGFFEWLIFWVLKICAVKYSVKKAKTNSWHCEDLTCHTEGVVRSISKTSNNRDSSLTAFAQNDKEKDILLFVKPQFTEFASEAKQPYNNVDCHDLTASNLAMTKNANSKIFDEIVLERESANEAHLGVRCNEADLRSSAISQKAEFAINTRKAFILLTLCCALTSAVLANDGAILIFTPLVLGLFLRARNATNPQIIAFLFATAFMCDISSNALTISNLTNIITARFYHIGFGDFARAMLLPNLFGIISAIALFLVVFRTSLNVPLLFRTSLKPKLSNKLFALHCACLCVFVASFFLSTHFSLPLSVNCGIYAGILLFTLWRKSHSKAKSTLKNAPFGIIIFVFGLFVVVSALTKTELQLTFDVFLSGLSHDAISSTFGVSVASAIGSSIFNNLPMVLFGNLTIHEMFPPFPFAHFFGEKPHLFTLSLASIDFGINTNLKQTLVYAHLLGCNIGSKLTPIGSLCTLLWLSLLAKSSIFSQRGITFGFWRYCKYALIFTPFVLCCACAGLWLGA
ncbi:ArsB/NhaD family transporter [Helicobacter sp. T3_23-1059]